MTMNFSYRLSTVVAASICGMVIFTALALGGVFSYSYIESLKTEFYDRVRAEGEEYSLEVYSFLHQAMARLEELGRDNSIRVTMMLGVDYPLSEKLAGYDQLIAGVDYFIQRRDDDKIFSSSSKAYNEDLVRHALNEAPYNCSLCSSEGGKIKTIYSIPIRSRSEIVGSAACVVNLANTRLRQVVRNTLGSRMILFDEGKFFDLLEGSKVRLIQGKSVGDKMRVAVLGKNTEGVLFKSSLVPGLSYFVSDQRLNNSLYRTFWLLMPLFVAVIGLSVIVAFFISDKLTRPLRTIMDSAEDISNGVGGSIVNKGSRIYEINALQNSLSSMLESLKKSKGLEQYQFFFDNVGDLVCITDINGTFLEVNSTVSSCLGYEREQFLNKTFYELVMPHERQTLRGILNSMFAGDTLESFECSLSTIEGKTIHCEVRSRKIEYKGSDALLSVVRDVTDRKRDEENLQRYASELLKAKEVQERNSARMSVTLKKLEDAMARAEIANRTKSEFLAQMSHEIRTPMNSVLGMADMLSETKLTSEQKSYVTIFRDSGKALLHLINDILDLSKIESGKLTLESTSFDIDRLVDEVAGVMSVAAWKKGLAFSCQVHPEMAGGYVGDPTRIKQIIVNLLSNAIKFTESGMVLLNVSSIPRSEGKVSLVMVVRDTGIGISEDKVDVIFENFVQADSSTTRKYGGTGLGLSITRNLVELMNGEISVRNLPSGGAEFRVEILVGKGEGYSLEDASVRAAVEGRKLLVIEDSPTVRNFICDCLTNWGAYCAHAGSSSFLCIQDETQVYDAELVFVSDKLGDEDGLCEIDTIRERMKLDKVNLCTLSSSPGDSSNRPEVNSLFGVKGSVPWPATRGGLRQAMLEIYTNYDADIRPDVLTAELLPLRLLVAEDSDSNRMLIDFFLKDTPFRISYVKDGIEAVEAYRTHKFDLVIMDIQMPVMDGFEAAREIRSYERDRGYPATPILALTANTYAEDREKCIKAGCTDYLAKPIKKITLIKSILQYCL